MVGTVERTQSWQRQPVSFVLWVTRFGLNGLANRRSKHRDTQRNDGAYAQWANRENPIKGS
eukprot:2830836-Amphidinium_carterae.1